MLAKLTSKNQITIPPIEGRAEVIVSGDEHLLCLSSSPMPVTTVTSFIEAS